MTFDEWRDLVKAAFQGSEPTEDQVMLVVKDGARAVMARDVESDLALAKSYRDSFKDGRFDVSSYRIEDVNAFVALVTPLMPVDDDTEAMADALENALKASAQKINDDADRWDALLIEAAVEMQRHVPFFTTRQENAYLKNSTGVVNEAFISRVAPPAGMRLTQMWFGKYYEALAEGTEYDAGDYVESNNRIYKVVTGGVLEDGELDDGLTSTDGDAEALGDLVFQYYAPVVLIPARNYPWIDRARLRAGKFSGGPLYALSDQADQIWFYPPLDDDHRFVMEWVGLKDSFEDDDEVTFDAKAAACAAHFIRSALQREILGDSRKSAEEFAFFQRELRGLVLDCEQREQGMSNRVAAYQYWGRCWPGCVPCLGGGSSSGGGTVFSLTSGFSETVNTLVQLAALATVSADVPIYLTFFNTDVGALQTWKLQAGTAATAEGIQRPTDYADGTNEKIWVLVG